jgi:uncharacterized membrane protein YoaK (UPF0700 family)
VVDLIAMIASPARLTAQLRLVALLDLSGGIMDGFAFDLHDRSVLLVVASIFSVGSRKGS